MSEFLNITKDDLKVLLEAAVKAAKAPNAREERELEEDIQREKRRTLLMTELARVEDERQKRLKNACSHSRDPRTGNAVAKGSGTWCTSGQLVGLETAVMICQRCNFAWTFRPTASEREYILNQGMLGMAPPSEDRLVEV
jgi:hypothetical protein